MSKPAKRIRKFVFSRHPGLVNEKWNDDLASSQGSCYLRPYEVSWIIQTPVAIFVLRLDPLMTDQCDQSVTPVYSIGDLCRKVGARLDRINVTEDKLFTENPPQVTIEAPCCALAIFPAITNENPAGAHHSLYHEQAKRRIS